MPALGRTSTEAPLLAGKVREAAPGQALTSVARVGPVAARAACACTPQHTLTVAGVCRGGPTPQRQTPPKPRLSSSRCSCRQVVCLRAADPLLRAGHGHTPHMQACGADLTVTPEEVEAEDVDALKRQVAKQVTQVCAVPGCAWGLSSTLRR